MGIHNKPTIKILGITLRNNLSMETQIGTLCANLHSRIHTIRQITSFTTFHTRLQSINYILDKCKLLDSKDMIAFASIKYINKILLHKTPRSIISNYSANNKQNTDNKLTTIYKPKTKKLGK